QAAMGIALYCMFIAIIIPPAKKSLPITCCVLLAIMLSCLLQYVPLFNGISYGFRAVISSVISAAVIALVFPIQVAASDEDEPSELSPSAKEHLTNE
ncbi:MAG: hypothetical protein J6W76_04790, partial [Spirochaetales bacterium]|nr:hypothetical protein [Spirochaetales bacterium]